MNLFFFYFDVDVQNVHGNIVFLVIILRENYCKLVWVVVEKRRIFLHVFVEHYPIELGIFMIQPIMFGRKSIPKMNVVGYIVMRVKIFVILHLFMKKDGRKILFSVLLLRVIMLLMLLGDMCLILNRQYKEEISMKNNWLNLSIELIEFFKHKSINNGRKQLLPCENFLRKFLLVCSRGVSRQIEDLASMLKEQNTAKESELHGRQSGSLTWKLSRGETDQEVKTNLSCYLINQQILIISG